MPRAYSNDLRRKVLEAHAAGKGSMRVLAEWFGVSLGWVEKISQQQRKTGQTERVEQRHGPLSRATPAVEEMLRQELRQAPDQTLAELKAKLHDQQGVELSVTQVWRVLQRLGLRLKKSPSMPLSRRVKPSVGSARSGGTRSPRWQPSN